MSFSGDVAKCVAKASERMDRAVRGVASDYAERITRNTPVGEEAFWDEGWDEYPGPGGLMANWQVSNTTVPTQFLSKLQPSPDAQASELKTQIQSFKAGDRITFANNTPYISTLEYGEYPWKRTQPGRVVSGWSLKVKAVGPGFFRTTNLHLIATLNATILKSIGSI